MSMIIKATRHRPEASAPALGHVAFNFDDMQDRAQSYVDQVRGQAAQLLAEAQRQADQIRKRSEEQGRQDALAQVDKLLDQKVAKELETLLPSLHQGIQAIQDSKQAWLRHWEQRTVQTAIAIAERILRRQLEQQPETTMELVREALQLAAGSAEITVHMHPSDLENLRGQVERLAAELCHLSPTAVVADPEIEAGSCRVETKFGSVDQQFHAQLARIEEELIR